MPRTTAKKNSRNRKSTPAKRAPKRPAKDVVKAIGKFGQHIEVMGVVGIGVALFSILAMTSFSLGQGTLMGPFGRWAARAVYGSFGIAGYAVVVSGGVIAVRLLMDQRPLARGKYILGGAIAMVSAATLLHIFGDSLVVHDISPGGALGQRLGDVLRSVVSTAGTTLLCTMGLLVAAVIATPLRMSQVLGIFGHGWVGFTRGSKVAGLGAAMAGREAARFSGEVIRAVLPERDDEDWDEHYEDDPVFMDDDGGVVTSEISGDTEKVDDSHILAMAETAEPAKAEKKSKKKVSSVAPTAVEDEAVSTSNTDTDSVAEETVRNDEGKPAAKKAPKKKRAKPNTKKVEVSTEPANDEIEDDDSSEPVIVERVSAKPDADEMKEKEKQADEDRLDFIPLGDGAYRLPSASLLNYDESTADPADRDAMLELSARLTKTLQDYGVKGEVTAICPGPVVTMYEFAPAPGTRVNKISGLADDLAMALEALSIRIVAPIPGKAVVGIEVPNKSRETVYLKEIITDDSFLDSKLKLPLSFGKDIEGTPRVFDLAKMPHLLVAGTTGSGKSVAVNSMITSLLYNSSPEQVRMIMVDPKMLELSIYEGIPHLLLPVVTDPKKANLALRWAVDEMERRYDLLASQGVRDLAGYNNKLEKLRKQWEADKLKLQAEAAARLAADDLEDDLEDTMVRTDRVSLDLPEEPPKTLPYIVVIIDEFADLMMCAPKEVETSVARIAQKARAAGIHLILATQRPSVDVITGLIKANFPSRVAFRVASKTDSRTVLDQSGAESLLGAGDMLFSDRGANPVRVHGCFVDEDEIHEVVEFLKTQAKPVYNLEILKPREEDGGEEGAEDSEPVDPMYDKAVVIVAESQNVSISMIQRRLRIGYNRAARIVETMEREGVVGSPDGTNKREVLIAAA